MDVGVGLKIRHSDVHGQRRGVLSLYLVCTHYFGKMPVGFRGRQRAAERTWTKEDGVVWKVKISEGRSLDRVRRNKTLALALSVFRFRHCAPSPDEYLQHYHIPYGKKTTPAQDRARARRIASRETPL